MRNLTSELPCRVLCQNLFHEQSRHYYSTNVADDGDGGDDIRSTMY